jgi:hypothetical protein
LNVVMKKIDERFVYGFFFFVSRKFSSFGIPNVNMTIDINTKYGGIGCIDQYTKIVCSCSKGLIFSRRFRNVLGYTNNCKLE